MPAGIVSFRPTSAKQATARIFAGKTLTEGIKGTGMLMHGQLVVTCLHVVRAVCGEEANEGSEVHLDFPFAEAPLKRPAEKHWTAKVAKGGWNPACDLAMLRLVDAPASVRGWNDFRTISDEDSGLLNCYGFGDSHGFDGENAELRLGKQAIGVDLWWASLRKRDDSGALYVEGGYSGAPVTDDRGLVVGLLKGERVADTAHGAKHLAKLILCHAISELYLAAYHPVSDGSKVDETGATDPRIGDLIASMRECLPVFQRSWNPQQLCEAIKIQLQGLEETISQPNQIKAANNELWALMQSWQAVQKIGLTRCFSSSPFGQLPRLLGALVPKLQAVDIAGACAIPNNWFDDETLPHVADVKALLAEIADQLERLKVPTPPLSEQQRLAASAELRLLRNLLYGDPLSLKALDDIRARLEALEKNLFRELIVACQLFLGQHMPRLPDLAIFRDRLADGSAGPEMVVLPARPGGFPMGSNLDEANLPEDDKADGNEIVPGQGKRLMRVPHRFAIGRFPVTFTEYNAFRAATAGMRPREKDEATDNDSGRADRPAIDVSWKDAIDYITWLNGVLAEGYAPYRLPSEAEWEYACRAGTETRRWWGDGWDPARANGVLSFEGGRTSPVGHYPPNPWRLHDMIGNVWEWCTDVYADNIAALPDNAEPNLEKQDASARRVLRGGSWGSDPRFLRSAIRYWGVPGLRYFAIGFRLSRTL